MDLQTKIHNFLQQATQGAQNFFQPAVNEVQQLPQQVQTFGQKLYQQALPQLAQAQQFIESPQQFTPLQSSVETGMPFLRSAPNDNIFQAIGKGAVKLPAQYVDTILGQGVLAPATDVGRLLGADLTNQPLPQYSSLKSAPVRLAFNLMGDNSTPQSLIGNTAGTFVPAVAAGAGSNFLKTGTAATPFARIAQGALLGGIGGAEYSGANALSENRNAPDIKTQAMNALTQMLIGGGAGALTGGALSGGKEFMRALDNQAIQAGQSPEQGGVSNQTLAQLQAAHAKATSDLNGLQLADERIHGKAFLANFEEAVQKKDFNLARSIAQDAASAPVGSTKAQYASVLQQLASKLPANPSEAGGIDFFAKVGGKNTIPEIDNNLQAVADNIKQNGWSKDEFLKNIEPDLGITDPGVAAKHEDFINTLKTQGLTPQSFYDKYVNLPDTPPGGASQSPGVASPAPDIVATQARIARSGMMQNVSFRANVLGTQMNQLLKTPEDNTLFRLAMEQPDQVEKIAQKSADPEGFLKAFNALSPKVSDFTDYVAKQTNQQNIPMNFVQDYFTHVLNNTNDKGQTLDDFLAANAKDFQSGFTKQRVFATLQDAIDAGFSLKNPNASQDIVQYASSMGKQLGASALDNTINQYRPGGAVNVRELGKMPYNYEGKMFQQSNVPGNQGTFVDPEIQKEMGHYNPSGFADNPIIAGKDVAVGDKTLHIPGVDQLNQLDKQAKLGLGGFHALNTTLRMISNDPSVIPQAFLNALDPQAKVAFQDQAIQDGVIDYGSKIGVTFSKSGDLLPSDASLLDKINSHNPITKFNDALFSGLINTYKINLVRGIMDKYDLSDPQQLATAQNVGSQFNNLMGGINYEAIGRNKTIQQALRLIGLAPDFSEGTARQLLAAANPKGYLNPTTRPAALFALKNVVGQVAVYATLAEVGRALTTGKFSPDVKSFVANSILKPSIPLPNNSLFNNPRTGKTQAASLPASEFSTIASGVKDPMHFLQARGSGVVSAAGSLASGKDYYGNPLVNPWNGTPDTLLNRAKALVPNQLPIPLQQGLKLQAGTQTPADTAINITGLRVGNNPNDPQVQAQTQYFNSLNQVANSLNPNDQKIFLGVIHPTTKDPSGSPVVDKSVNLTPEKYQAFIDHPAVLTAEQQLQQSQSQHAPMWDLPPAQLKAYLAYSLSPDSGVKAQVRLLNPWIPQMQMYQQQYAQQFAPNAGSFTASPMQQLTPQQVQVVSAYTASPQGSPQRKQLLAQNPWLPAYWNASSAYYQNNPNANMPQTPLNAYLQSQGISPANGGGSSSSFSSSSSSSRGPFRPFSSIGFGLKANSKGNISNPVKPLRNKQVQFKVKGVSKTRVSTASKGVNSKNLAYKGKLLAIKAKPHKMSLALA